jgi:hypothetical protein
MDGTFTHESSLSVYFAASSLQGQADHSHCTPPRTSSPSNLHIPPPPPSPFSWTPPRGYYHPHPRDAPGSQPFMGSNWKARPRKSPSNHALPTPPVTRRSSFDQKDLRTHLSLPRPHSGYLSPLSCGWDGTRSEAGHQRKLDQSSQPIHLSLFFLEAGVFAYKREERQGNAKRFGSVVVLDYGYL